MENNNNRTRDSRRSSSTANAFPRRRHPTISLRRSSQEGEVELQETVRLRGKRERVRDREQSKRRRGSHSHSTEEESVGYEQHGDVFDAGVSRVLSSNTASSAPDHHHRRTFRPTPPPHPPPSNNITREIIGVTVPRKARSACVKRTHESWVSATLEEQSLQSGEAASPSSSVVSLKKRMKSIGPKTRVPIASRSGSSTQEDIEIEIAELLYGLKTSNSSSSHKLEPSTSPSSLPSSDAEKKKVEDHCSSALATNDSDQSAKVEKLPTESAKVTACGDVDSASGREIGSLEAAREGHDLNSGAGCGITPDRRSEFFAGESPSRSKSKLDVDKHEDSASARDVYAVHEDKGQRVDKFEIDLMAPPPMMLSPERDSLSRGEDSVKAEDKAERLVKREKTKEDFEEVKMGPFKEKMDVLKLDLKNPNEHNEAGTNNKLEEQGRNKEQPTKLIDPKVEKTGLSSSVPFSTVVPERPSSLYPLGYMPTLQTAVKTDKTTGLSTAPPQHENLVLSQPRAKRCATHHYIAYNIFLHQQCAKTNPLLPSAVGSGSLSDTKHSNINRMPSAESIVVGKQSRKHSLGVNQNAAQEKGWAATSDYSLAVVRSSTSANLIDSTQMKQLVLQQGPHPGSTGNLMHGPAFLFPPGQHQASVTTTTIQAGGVNSTSSASSSNKSHNSAAGSLGTSSTLPAVAPAMSFSYPNLAANDTPYMTIVQNSGYPFPFSTPLGASAAIRGVSPAQATPILSGPLYSSQMFHPLQHPQQHLHSQALVQPSYLNASTSSGSSSSHKQSQGTQVNGSGILTSTTRPLQQSQKQHTSQANPRKHETGMTGENAPSVASGTDYSQKNVFGQNFNIPVQPLNLSFRPSGTSDSVGGNSGNFGDKQQQPQALKGVVERIPSQAFAISFAAFNGTSVPSNLNFSSMAQNPVIFQSLPDIAWQGYQAANASHTAQQKIYSINEGKSGGKSSHQDDEKQPTSGKPSTNGPTTLVFDNSSKNLNYVSSPMNGNWPSRSITSTSTTTSLPLSSITSSSQQPPQLLHLQQQHGMLQRQPAMATQYKASSTNTTATKVVNSPTVFSQTLNQCKSSNQASQSKNSGRTPDCQAHNTSIITSAAPTVKSFSLEQGIVLQGHTQISFGGSYIPSLPPQGQQLLNNTQPFGTTVAGTPPNRGNLKTNSQGSKLVSSSVNTSQVQQTENSSAGTGQKSSPVCGRNVPSILSSYPGHLSELKY